jgi:hypothetical protein
LGPRFGAQLRQVTNLDATIFGHDDCLRCCNLGRYFGDDGLFVIQIETHDQPPKMMLGCDITLMVTYLASVRTRRPKLGVHCWQITTRQLRDYKTYSGSPSALGIEWHNCFVHSTFNFGHHTCMPAAQRSLIA